MIVKMCRNNISRHIICRMLHRSEWVDIFPVRKYNDSSRMLSGTSADTGTSLNNPVNFASSLSCSPLFKIVLYIPKCCLIRQRTNRSGTERLSGSENDFRIFMGITLIISWEVQIDIWLFISFKSKECFERNIKSIFYKPGFAHRALLIRHIPSTAPCVSPYFFGFKITVVALRAIVMWA